MSGVSTAPPMIAITISEPPSLAVSPSPRIPWAKIVGNISDMKKLVSSRAIIPVQPGNKTPIAASNVLTTA